MNEHCTNVTKIWSFHHYNFAKFRGLNQTQISLSLFITTQRSYSLQENQHHRRRGRRRLNHRFFGVLSCGCCALMAKKRIMEKFEANWNRKSSSSQEQSEEEEPSNGVEDLFSGTGFNYIHRGSRMARARRSSLDSLNFPKSNVPPPPLPPVIDITRLNYLFKKQLKNSDVSTLRRIVIPKKEAEAYLPFLNAKEGITINMLDMDGVHKWCFKFRFWPNNSSRMYVLECTGDFVNTHGLKPGDYIILHQTADSEKYIIEAKKTGSSPQIT